MSKEKETPQVVEEKTIRHELTPEELLGTGRELAQSIAAHRDLESQFDEVKQSYKAKLAEAEAKIGRLGTLLQNGFDMRVAKCRVEFRPKERKKYFYLEYAPKEALPVLVEDMTREDFQVDLIQAESKFERREEIPLFPPAGDSNGVLAVGRHKDRWHAALRLTVGKHSIAERLNTESKPAKERADIIRQTLTRAMEWLVDTFGAENAKGFEAHFSKVIETHKGRAE